MSSAEVAALIGEVETSVTAAEETAAEACACALDPTVLDPSARTAAADAEFTRDRLQAALPKLQTRLAELQTAEAYARWVAEYDRVKPLRDAQGSRSIISQSCASLSCRAGRIGTSWRGRLRLRR